MIKTTNYQLPKWEKTDRIQMKDFNDMTATLDTALKANADAIAAETAAREAGDAAVQGELPYVKLLEASVTEELAPLETFPVDVSGIDFTQFRRIEFHVAVPASYPGNKSVLIQANNITSYTSYGINNSGSRTENGFVSVGSCVSMLSVPCASSVLSGWTFNGSELYFASSTIRWDSLQTLTLCPYPGNAVPAGTVFTIYGVRR